MLFSSAIAANVIRRFKSTCRSFSKRMTAMTIMHEPHVVGNHLDCVSQKSAQGEFNATGKRFAR
jgi:hypothetical protein